jgi:hypothetical protein
VQQRATSEPNPIYQRTQLPDPLQLGHLLSAPAPIEPTDAAGGTGTSGKATTIFLRPTHRTRDEKTAPRTEPEPTPVMIPAAPPNPSPPPPEPNQTQPPTPFPLSRQRNNLIRWGLGRVRTRNLTALPRLLFPRHPKEPARLHCGARYIRQPARDQGLPASPKQYPTKRPCPVRRDSLVPCRRMARSSRGL